MSEIVDVLVMIHGMVPEPDPLDPSEVCKAFRHKLVQVERNLPSVFDDEVYVQWGHELSNTPPQDMREDQRLTQAQSFAHNRVAYDAVRTDPHPNNRLMSGSFGFGVDYNLTPGLRNIITTIRDTILHFGLGDAVYYCAPEGEEYIRRTVYEQVLTVVDQFKQADTVRLHLVGHSLGVTLTHDFLFGLFASDHDPGFVEDDQGSELAKALFIKWRDKAQTNVLQLGTLISMASQLPVFMLRKQSLVNQLFNGELLDPAKIGIQDEATIRWLIFYDVDDILGFTTRRLYHPSGAIKEIQVDTDDWPNKAHTGYWTNKTVLRETAQLLLSNAGG
ncbi:hypothetical protein ACFLXQ_04405 [Chloroflexota bacterium]